MGLVVLVAAHVACSHDPNAPPAPAPTSVPASASAFAPAPAFVPAPVPVPVPVPAPAPASAPAGEAHRSTIARLEADPLLLPHLPALRDHFGVAASGPFMVQRIELTEARTAALVMRSDESDPIAIAFDRDQLLWSKVRPTAGILSPVNGLTLAARPDGGAVLFGWVAPLHMVAARMWADDGNPFGDFELFAPDACDALSAAYGPGQGWLAVCTSARGTRAQRMREDGTIAWGQTGAAVGATSRSGPASILFDSPSSVMLLEQVPAVGGDRLLVYRYDAEAQPLWPAPVDLGSDLGPRPSPAARIDARVVRDGLVQVERRSGVAGRGAARTTELTSSGEVHFL
ncbi:MAG TPA: hypothetical protein VII82_03110 [Polyangiaceae bacterium]